MSKEWNWRDNVWWTFLQKKANKKNFEFTFYYKTFSLVCQFKKKERKKLVLNIKELPK